MAYSIVDFEDIVRSVLAELKIPATDMTELNRIKQDINEVYINEVAPFRRWNWLRKKAWLAHSAFYGSSSITATVTPDSTTVTMSATCATSKAGYVFAADNDSEIYYISAHTAGTDTLTLSTAWTGTASSTATFKIWKDWLALPTNCRETVQVISRHMSKQLEVKGLQEFNREVNGLPRREGRPVIYTTDDFIDPSTTGDDETESDRYRVLRIYPSVYNANMNLEVEYIQDVTPLDLDGDEPLMPVHDRNVLRYGALWLAWSRHRNEERSVANFQLFERKLARMAGKVEDSVETPQIVPNAKYLLQKRGSRLGWGSLNVSSGGSSSYASPTYIKDAELATGNSLTGNLSVDAGVTIDGVDLSELADDVTVLTTLSSGKIIVGSGLDAPIAVTPSGDVTISNLGVTAITALIIEDGDINASAAITRSKLATGTADHVVINSAAGVMSSEVTLSPVRGGTGVANNAAATLTRSGNHALTITTTGTTGVTLPTTGTLATLAGSETLTNKTLTSPVINTPTGIVKADVGLGNVDNTSDATKNAASVTLTNKTLTSPVINTPTGIVKGDVGLGNVDNTSDASKPVSTATQTSLDLKANLASPALTGNPTAPTQSAADNSTKIATTAYVDAKVSDTAYAGSWDAVTGIAPSKNAVYDQVELRAPKANPTFSGTITTPLTASRVLTTGASNELAASTVTTTTLGYLDATSSIQTQLDSKASTAAASQAYGLTNGTITNSVGSNILTVALKIADGSTNPSGGSPVTVGMRSSTATSGAFNTRTISAALSQTLSAGTKLQFIDATAAYLYAYLLDSDGAGTMKIALATAYYDDGTLQSVVKESNSVTCTSASPAVITDTGHNRNNGDCITVTGTVPTGFPAAGTALYIINKATNTYQVSLTEGGAAINSSSTGSSLVSRANDGRLVSDGYYSSMPIRYIGRMLISETTAGTYASAATEVSPLPAKTVPSYALSGSSGTYTNGTTGFTDVTNLSVTIQCDGVRPVIIQMMPTSTLCKVTVTRITATTAEGEIKFLRGTTSVALFNIGIRTAIGDPLGYWPPSSFLLMEIPSAGIHTYKVQARVSAGTNSELVSVTACTLAAYQVN